MADRVGERFGDYRLKRLLGKGDVSPFRDSTSIVAGEGLNNTT